MRGHAVPAFPTDEQIRWTGARLAELALERAAEAAEAHLRTAAHDHFPDHDAYDLNRLVPRLREELRVHAQLVYQRRIRMEGTGTVRAPGTEVSPRGPE